MSNNLIDEKTTDSNGNIVFTLPYGKYVIKQITKKDGISSVKDFEVTIKNNDELLEYTLVNRVIPRKTVKVLPRTKKKSYLSLLLMILSILLFRYNYEKKYL